MKRSALITLAVLSLGLAGCTASAEAEAKPTPTVTVTSEPVVKEVEVTKEVTPQSCHEALDIAAEAMTIMSEVQGLMSPALEAAATWDSVTLDNLSAEIKGHNDELNTLAPSLSVAVTACRSK